MRWITPVLLLLAACHHDAQPVTAGQPHLVDPAPIENIPCAAALDPVAHYLTSRPAKDGIVLQQSVFVSMNNGDNGATMAQMMVDHCDRDDWSAEIRTCFAHGDPAKPQPCMDLLNDRQKQLLGTDLMRVGR